MGILSLLAMELCIPAGTGDRCMIGWKGITKVGHRTSLRELRRLVDDEVGIQWPNAVCEINGFCLLRRWRFHDSSVRVDP